MPTRDSARPPERNQITDPFGVWKAFGASSDQPDASQETPRSSQAKSGHGYPAGWQAAQAELDAQRAKAAEQAREAVRTVRKTWQTARAAAQARKVSALGDPNDRKSRAVAASLSPVVAVP